MAAWAAGIQWCGSSLEIARCGLQWGLVFIVGFAFVGAGERRIRFGVCSIEAECWVVQDEEEVAPTTKGLSHAASIGGASKAAFDDALLGKINRTTAEGKRISTLARHNDPVFDIRNDKFDPCKYLAAVHKETPRSRMEYGVERLQKMAGQGGKVCATSLHADSDTT
eukprot:3692477-Rhodomonas_salina.1